MIFILLDDGMKRRILNEKSATCHFILCVCVCVHGLKCPGSFLIVEILNQNLQNFFAPKSG